MTRHYLIFIPGLGGRTPLLRLPLKLIMRLWEKDGFRTYLFDPQWRSESAKFYTIQEKLTQVISKLSKNNSKVSLIGMSAGGSLGINMLATKKTKVHRVINVCGRIRVGKDTRPSLEIAAAASPSFKESVLQCEKHLKLLSASDKKKIMNIYGLWDETVPITTTPIKGATNLQIKSILHLCNIGVAITIYKRRIIEFLRN